MFARLWWKEARQTWPVWAFLALVGVAVQLYLFRDWSAQMSSAGYAYVSLVVTMMYLFLIAAAVFAGERENGTLWILDAMPADRLRVWTAKVSFALATTAALGALLWLSALTFGRRSPGWQAVGIDALVWGLTALGWSLLWSSVLANALRAAVLAMVSLSVTLLCFEDLQEPGASPGLLILAALTTGLSAWAFRANGPPGRGARRGRTAPPAAAAPLPNEAAADRRAVRIWTAAVPRLLWETLRQVRGESWLLVGLTAASALAPYLVTGTFGNRNDAALLTILGMVVLGGVTGVLAFNGENRGRTHRFLLQHGARPGVVWGVKVGAWWAVSVVLWAIAIVPVWQNLPHPPLGLTMFAGIGSILAWGISGLTIAFAIAVVCGMAFRRGIMAGAVAALATLAVAVPVVSLLVSRVMFPSFWPCIAAGVLAVSWAWSGDWLREGTGWRRWARLALYTAAVPVILAPCYIAGRAWSVPALAPERLFERSRVVAPVPERDNAAPLYREASLLISRNAYPLIEVDAVEAPPAVGNGMSSMSGPTSGGNVRKSPAWMSDLRQLDRDSFDPPPAGVTAWLEQLEPALAKLREGARKPYCRFLDLRTATEFDRAYRTPLYNLLVPLAVSARVRLAQGDLEGSWTEIETLQRMARQYSYASLWSAQLADPVAEGLVLRWATDPRQTAATLERVARAWKDLPPAATPADRARVDAALFHNLLAMPREELIEEILYGTTDLKRKVSSTRKIEADLQSTPWEIARTRRAFDLLAAARIQKSETSPLPFLADRRGMPSDPWRWFSPMVDPHWSLSLSEGRRRKALSPVELNLLTYTTPLLQYSSLGRDTFLMGRAEVNRRAIWLVLLLRLHQARHDGKLPETLDTLLARPAGDDGPFATAQDLIDPYSGKPFGYVPSHGQRLLPIGLVEDPSTMPVPRFDFFVVPTDGYRLLYSIGADGIDDRAERNAGLAREGDVVFPLRDNLRPPGSGPR